MISLRLLYIFSKIIGSGRFPSWYLFSIFSKIFPGMFQSFTLHRYNDLRDSLRKKLRINHWMAHKERDVFHNPCWISNPTIDLPPYHPNPTYTTCHRLKKKMELGTKNTKRFVAWQLCQSKEMRLGTVPLNKKTRSFLGVGRMKFQVSALSLIFGALLKIPRILRVNFRRKSPWFLGWRFPWFCERHHTSTKPSKTPWPAPRTASQRFSLDLMFLSCSFCWKKPLEQIFEAVCLVGGWTNPSEKY